MIEKMFIRQGIKRIELEEFLKKDLEKAGFTKAEIVKTPLVTRIIVNVVKPGLAIGRSGQNIRALTETIEKKFGIDNPQLEIKEIEKPDLDAAAVANKMKALIERGFSWRSIVYRTLKNIVDAGAEGVEIIASGKLTGKGGRKRKQRIIYGYMKKVGHQTELVDYAKASACTKAGAIGLKIKIVKPGTVFPDKINIKELLTERGIVSSEETDSEEKTAEAKEEVKETKESAENKKEPKTEEKKGEKTPEKEETKEVKEKKAEKKAEEKTEKTEKKPVKKENKEAGEKKEKLEDKEKKKKNDKAEKKDKKKEKKPKKENKKGEKK